jgi:hypothetical protein
MDAQHNNSITSALDTGDLYGLLDAMGPDEREDFWQVANLPGTPDGRLVAARVGSMLIAVFPNGTMTIHGHDSAEEASECLQAKLPELRQMVEEANAQARQIQASPMAQLLAQMGGLIPTVDQDDDEPTVAIGRAQVPVLDPGPGTGFYV